LGDRRGIWPEENLYHQFSMVLLERPVPVWAHGLTHGDGGKRAGETELGMVWYGMVWYTRV